MRPIRLIACHRGDRDSFIESPLCKSAAGRFPLYFHPWTPEGIPVIYNRFLRGQKDGFENVGQPDSYGLPEGFAIFVADDLEIIGNNVERELSRWADAGFSILGVAGASRLEVKAPARWQSMAGERGGTGVSVFHNQTPTPTGPLREAVVLDGMFLAVVWDQAEKVGWEFDERFPHHHYDIASCLRARSLGLKLRTVFVPVNRVVTEPTLGTLPGYAESECRFLLEFGN